MDNKTSDLVRLGLWAQSKLLDDIKTKLRAKIPKLTLYDIRIERDSYHKAVLCDLYEAGFQQSAQFIESLIQMEEEYQVAYKLPHLYLQTNVGKHCLATIAEYMKMAELEMQSGNEENSAKIILKLAQQLSSQETQLWIVEQIYIASIRATKAYRLDGGLLEARVRYYYGKFLIERGSLYDIAYETLTIAYNMSIGRDWTIHLEADVEKPLHKEVSYLLFLCISNNDRSQSHSEALEYSKKALKYALTSGNKYITTRAYLDRGDSEMNGQNYEEAEKCYSKAITFAEISSQTDLVCQGYLKKGYALQKNGQFDRATTFAKFAKKAAETCDSKYYLGKSYILYGEIAVSRLLMNNAAQNFMTAADIFSELADTELAREARFLGAFATSHLVLEQMVDLIRKSARSRVREGFDRLMQWKERRTPFWDVEDENRPLRRISVTSGMDRKKSILAIFGYHESVSTIEYKGLDDHITVGNVHIFREFREWLSTY